MLIETMTPQEMREQFSEDLKQVKGRIPHLIGRWTRYAHKKGRFPIIEKGTTKNGNTFLLRVTNGKSFSTRLYLRMVTSNGYALVDDTDYHLGDMAVTKDGYIPVPIKVYTPHLMRRYKERFGLKEYKDIEEQFVKRLDYAAVTACDLDSPHSEHYDYLAVIPDGFLFGTSDTLDRVIWRTYLSDKQLTDKQWGYVNHIVEVHNELAPLFMEHKEKMNIDYMKNICHNNPPKS